MYQERGERRSHHDVGRRGGGEMSWRLPKASISQWRIIPGYQLKWRVRRMGAGGLGKEEKVHNPLGE